MARRDRSRHSLKRQGPKREPYDRVLIVCEGEKTEPIFPALSTGFFCTTSTPPHQWLFSPMWSVS